MYVCLSVQVTAGLVTEQLLSALQYDNQLSVRYLIEWEVVLLLRAHPYLTADLFLPCLKYVCMNVCMYVCMYVFVYSCSLIGKLPATG